MNRAKLLLIMGYNSFFWLAFWLFCYWTFPYDRLAAFLADKVAQSGSGYALEIGELSPYWGTGVELTDVKVHKQRALSAPTAKPKAGEAAASESGIKVRQAHARIGMLGLLFGTRAVTFDAALDQGEIEGSYEEDSESK